MIEQLPTFVPNPERSDRTRARCHERMARQVQARDQKLFAIERAVVVGVSAIYLSAVAFDVMRLLAR